MMDAMGGRGGGGYVILFFATVRLLGSGYSVR